MLRTPLSYSTDVMKEQELLYFKFATFKDMHIVGKLIMFSGVPFHKRLIRASLKSDVLQQVEWPPVEPSPPERCLMI